MGQHDDMDLKEAPRLTDSLTQSQHHTTPERAGGSEGCGTRLSSGPI